MVCVGVGWLKELKKQERERERERDKKMHRYSLMRLGFTIGLLYVDFVIPISVHFAYVKDGYSHT